MLQKSALGLIREYFGGNSRPVSMDELRALTAEDRRELAEAIGVQEGLVPVQGDDPLVLGLAVAANDDGQIGRLRFLRVRRCSSSASETGTVSRKIFPPLVTVMASIFFLAWLVAPRFPSAG